MRGKLVKFPKKYTKSSGFYYFSLVEFTEEERKWFLVWVPLSFSSSSSSSSLACITTTTVTTSFSRERKSRDFCWEEEREKVVGVWESDWVFCCCSVPLLCCNPVFFFLFHFSSTGYWARWFRFKNRKLGCCQIGDFWDQIV